MWCQAIRTAVLSYALDQHTHNGAVLPYCGPAPGVVLSRPNPPGRSP